MVIILAAFSLIDGKVLCVPGQSSSGLARALFEERDYYRAITEYKRLSFFSVGTQEKRRASFRIGECYRRSGRWEKALPHLLDGARFRAPDPLTDSCIVSLAKSYIELGSYRAAREMLDSLGSRNVPTRVTLVGWSYLMEGDFRNARTSFLSVSNSSSASCLAELSAEGERIPMKSARVAGAMSALIPGSGQVYAGACKQGFISFLLHGVMGYLLYKSVKAERYFEAAVTLYTGLSRFYVGNIMAASRLAREKNERERLLLIEEARRRYGGDLE
ncbi:MAG: tol-pal system YbgF family protein [bacterium]